MCSRCLRESLASALHKPSAHLLPEEGLVATEQSGRGPTQAGGREVAAQELQAGALLSQGSRFPWGLNKSRAALRTCMSGGGATELSQPTGLQGDISGQNCPEGPEPTAVQACSHLLPPEQNRAPSP